MFACSTPDQIGDSISSQIAREGPRTALTKLFGLEIVWDAKSFEVN